MGRWQKKAWLILFNLCVYWRMYKSKNEMIFDGIVLSFEESREWG